MAKVVETWEWFMGRERVGGGEVEEERQGREEHLEAAESGAVEAIDIS